MADSNPFAPENWLEAQRKYWDAWRDMTRQTLESTTAKTQRPPEAPWAEALDQWWKAVSSGIPSPTQDFFERLMSLGRSYFAMAEQMAPPASSGIDSTKALRNWLDQLTRTFHSIADSAGVVGQPQAKDFAALWQLPMDTWQRAVSSSSPVPGDFLKALQPEDISPLGEAVRDHLDRFLSVPGIGYTRESQEQYQTLGRLLLDYQQAMRDYNVGFSKVGLKSIDVFREKLEETARKDGPVNSLRALFNLWVDACEDVYAEYVMSEEYSQLYGDMVNALMAVKHHGGLLVDEYLESMNMPTRREVTTLHHRLQETRREIRGLRTQLEHIVNSSATKATSKPATTKSSKPKTQSKAASSTKAAVAAKGGPSS